MSALMTCLPPTILAACSLGAANVFSLPLFINPTLAYIKDDDGMEGPADQQDPATHLRLAFERFASDEAIISPSLRSQFATDKDQILSDAVARLSRLAKIPSGPESVSPERIARVEINEWVKQKRIDLAYFRYRNLLSEFNVPEERLHTRRSFTIGRRKKTPYDHFRVLEAKGLAPGAKIHYCGEVYTIRIISRDARIILEGHTGRISPRDCDVITDSEDEGPEAT